MKKFSFVFFVVLVAVLVPGLVFAQSEGVTQTTVPFAFYAGDKLMPAGTYVTSISNDQSELFLRNQDGSASCILTDLPTASAIALTPGMRFHEFNGTYFLRAIKDSDHEFEFAEPAIEKTMLRERTVAQAPSPAAAGE